MVEKREVFPYPIIKEVDFEIRFPNLFYVETKMGDLQIKIMSQFPESKLIYQHQIMFADTGAEGKFTLPHDLPESEAARKIWNFKSGTGVEVNVKNNSLSIYSLRHKTYDNPSSNEKFRDTIEFVVSKFMELTSIPIIKRIGLRYINECPVVQKSNSTFKKWYNTTFPLDRFDISDVKDMTFGTTIKRGQYLLRFIETLVKKKEVYKLNLDIDGFAEEVNPAEYLNVTDALHTIISNEYFLSVKEPLLEYMRHPWENVNE